MFRSVVDEGFAVNDKGEFLLFDGERAAIATYVVGVVHRKSVLICIRIDLRRTRDGDVRRRDMRVVKPVCERIRRELFSTVVREGFRLNDEGDLFGRNGILERQDTRCFVHFRPVVCIFPYVVFHVFQRCRRGVIAGVDTAFVDDCVQRIVRLHVGDGSFLRRRSVNERSADRRCGNGFLRYLYFHELVCYGRKFVRFRYETDFIFVTACIPDGKGGVYEFPASVFVRRKGQLRNRCVGIVRAMNRFQRRRVQSVIVIMRFDRHVLRQHLGHFRLPVREGIALLLLGLRNDDFVRTQYVLRVEHFPFGKEVHLILDYVRQKKALTTVFDDEFLLPGCRRIQTARNHVRFQRDFRLIEGLLLLAQVRFIDEFDALIIKLAIVGYDGLELRRIQLYLVTIHIFNKTPIGLPLNNLARCKAKCYKSRTECNEQRR